MKYLALIAALSAVAFPAAAQYGTSQDWQTDRNGNLYYMPRAQMPTPYGEQLVQKYTRLPQSTTCTTYGNQTTCTSN